MASAATPHWSTHYLSPDDIPCKSPGPRPPVSVYDSMITVKVLETTAGAAGEPDSTVTKEFPIYRGLLCFHSRFFDRALNGLFKEGGSVVYNMTDCSIRTFTLVQNWMNTGVARFGVDDDEVLTDIDVVHLYTFADFYGIPVLKNGALELYFKTRFEAEFLDLCDTRETVECAPENSPLKKLALDVLMDICEFDIEQLKQACMKSAQLGMDILERCWSRKIIPGGNIWNGFPGSIEWDRDMRKHFCERYHDHTEAGVDSKAKA